MQCYDQEIQRYYQVLTSYLSITKQIELCAREDKGFYQDVCFLFAGRIKAIQAELADKGIILCQGNSKLSTGDNFPKEKEETMK
ncbi:MAG: hypothetical protein ACQEWU_10010 [Bacillota bacterium]